MNMRSIFSRKLQLWGPTVITALIILGPVFAAAQAPANSGNNTLPANSGNNQAPANSGYNNPLSGPNTLQNPLGVSSICDLIGLLLKAAIAIGIPIAVLFIVWAGFKFILARGSPGELTEARNNLLATLIGIAIFVGASLIANVIISTLHQLGANGVNSC